MNILFLTVSRIDSVAQRGIYTDLVRELIRRGHKVCIADPMERRFHKPTHLVTTPEGAQILRVRTLNIQKTNVVEKGLATLLLEGQFLRAIRRQWGQVKFDLVLYSTPPITFNKVIEAFRRQGARTYLMLKDIFPQNAVDLGMMKEGSALYRLFRRKEKKLYALSDRIGCMSPANVRYVLRHNPEVEAGRVELCPNAVEPRPLAKLDAEEAAALRQKLGIPPGKVLSVYGGNLGRPQGVDFLLEVVRSNEARPDSYILIVGAGTEFRRMSQWFEANQPRNARLLASLPKDEYDRLLPLADIGLIFLDARFTIPNYPSRLTAYMENALPSLMATDVNTDIGPLAQEGGYGLWAPAGDLAAFDRQFDTLLASTELRARMGAAARRYLEENYTVGRVAETILNTDR